MNFEPVPRSFESTADVPVLAPAQLPIGPVPESARIKALDVARGFALLGIFFVNIQSFGQPLGEFMQPAPRDDSSIPELFAFYFVKIFCESKFYPLFSLLFGIGLAIQFERAQKANRPFWRLGLRRLGILFLFGLTHALALWYGDVLHLYAVTGVILLFLIRCRVRTLLITAIGLQVVGILAACSLALLIGAPAQSPPLPDPPPHFDDPFGTFWNVLTDQKLSEEQLKDGPTSSLWIQTEMQAYREGPYVQLFLFRLFTWTAFVFFECFGSVLFVGSLFLFGAAIRKAGVFEPEKQPVRQRLFRVGLWIGLPGSILAAFLPRILPGTAGHIIAALLVLTTGPLLSLAYLMGWTLVVENGWWRGLTSAMANLGRMALSNYLLQTLIATTIFYFYGFGLFGRTTRVERIGIVVAVYVLQLVFSTIWLQFFRFGPMEWLWRSLTYLQPQPLLRRSSIATE